jgi:hypothetical protein
MDPTNILTTAQLFAVWKAVEAMSSMAVPALPILAAASEAGHQPAFIAALYALNLRDAIHLIEPFKRMGASEIYAFDVDGDVSVMTKTWPFAVETACGFGRPELPVPTGNRSNRHRPADYPSLGALSAGWASSPRPRGALWLSDQLRRQP